MSDRDHIERTLRQIYQDRAAGKIDAIVGAFADDAKFRLAGSADASPVCAESRGGQQFREHLAGLVKAFQMYDPHIQRMLIDGSRAAVHWRVHVTSTATGKSATTELFDLVEFENGKISSFTEFCDTALAASLIAK